MNDITLQTHLRSLTRYCVLSIVCMAGLLIGYTSATFAQAVESVEPDQFCTMIVELIETEIAEELAAGDISQSEADAELQEMIPDQQACICYWTELPKLAGAEYTMRMQSMYLDPPTLGEIQQMEESGLLDLPNGLDEDELTDQIESTCGAAY